MSQKDYRCICNKCGHEFIAHECSQQNPAKCTECGATTQQCIKI